MKLNETRLEKPEISTENNEISTEKRRSKDYLAVNPC